jgi:hypothetical protein
VNLFLRKKMYALSLSLCLLVAIVIGVVAQTFANATSHTPSETMYGEHGEVIVTFPQPSTMPNSSMPSHPTTLRLIASIVDSPSEYGASSTIIVQLWIPAASSFVPVAQIVSSDNSELDSNLQTLWNGTPVWNPLMHNIFHVDSQTLNVWRDGSLIIANLTAPVTITLPFNLLTTANVVYGNQTFILPPLTLTFHPIGSPVPLHEVVSLVPSPPLSGYTMDITSLMSPAWVRVEVPTWVKGSWLECSGHICTDIVEEITPPAT